MPIGKNSIKRVANNGYSAVETKAPDMENSTVLTAPAPEVVVKVAPSAEKVEKAPVTPTPAAKKADAPKKKAGRPKKEAIAQPTEKKRPGRPKKAEADQSAARKSPKKSSPKAKKTAPAAFAYINIGEDLPIHLL